MQRQNSKQTIYVCVDSLEDNVWCGRLYGFEKKEEMAFHSFVDMILMLNQIQDGFSTSTSHAPFRRFLPDTDETSFFPPFETVQPGEKATFLIQILFHENASWQGTVQWFEGKKEENFRSELELIFLMNDAVRSCQDNPQPPEE